MGWSVASDVSPAITAPSENAPDLTILCTYATVNKMGLDPPNSCGALWLHIDDETEARLRQLANESRKRASRRRAARSKPNTS
jgi:hypothetical protein